MDNWNNSISELGAVQKLMVNSTNRSGHQSEHRQPDKAAEGTFIDADTPVIIENEPTSLIQISKIEFESIHLHELILKLNSIEENNPIGSQDGILKPRMEEQYHKDMGNAISHRETIEVNLTINTKEYIEGLTTHPLNEIESDRYLFKLSPCNQIEIIDKWAQRGTRICSEPVDLNTLETSRDNELNHSPEVIISHITFMLMDGTHLTLTIQDNIFVKFMDIIKGNQHIHAENQAVDQQQNKNPIYNLLITSDGFESEHILSQDQVIYAGGEGNDWYTASGLLIWGKKASQPINPAARLNFSSSQTVQENISIHRIEKSI